MKKKYFIIYFICVMVIFLLSVPSSAIMIGMGTEELAIKSIVAVRGEVAKVEAQWSEDGKTIVTRASIIVTDVIRGEITSKMIMVEYEGGEIGDIGLRVSDISPFETGEDVILLLKSIKSKIEGEVYSTVGKAQGKYTIDNEGIARKSGFSVLSGEDIIDYDIPVEKLIDKIRRAK